MAIPSTAITRAQARKIDEGALDEYGMPGALLMENAGRGCADVLCRLGIEGPVAICCGKGNNAGDGFVIARHLDLRGYDVRVLLWSDMRQLRGDAALNLGILQSTDVPIIDCHAQDTWEAIGTHLVGVDWIVDALLGTGAEGSPRPPLAGVIRVLNAIPVKKLAVDLPSGLNCDTGEVGTPTFRSDHTCTFVAPKIGFQQTNAKAVLGQVHVVDIGAPRKLIQKIVGSVPEFEKSWQ